MDAYCLGPLASGSRSALSDTATVSRVPAVICCNRVSKIVVVQEVPLAYPVTIFNSCVCNELHALYRRHLVSRDFPIDLPLLKRVFNHIINREILPQMPPVLPVDFDCIVNRYRGAKRAAYAAAAVQLGFDRFEKTWSVISMFVKGEKASVWELKDKVPRAIQFRRPMFNLLLATYLHPLEVAFYNIRGMLGLPIIAKGLNNVTRATILTQAKTHFRRPVFLMMDISKMDSCVTKEHLKLEHKFYNRVMKCRYLRRLLKFQIKNRGYSKGGIKYSILGTRMSGDYNTGLGNTLISVVLMWYFLRAIVHFFLADGDDMCAIIEEEDLASLDFELFRLFGFDVKVDISTNEADIMFCRSKLLPVDPPRFAREPVRALSNIATSLKQYYGEGINRYLAGVGQGQLSVSNGVPILGPIALKMSSLSNKPIYDESYMARYGPPAEILPITDEVRVAYAEAWGISPTQQIELENLYAPPRVGAPLLDWYNSLSDINIVLDYNTSKNATFAQ